MNNNIPYWRNDKGELFCPGDSCPRKVCLYSCPLYRQSIMLDLYKAGKIEKARALAEEILDEVPDYYQVWGFLGNVRGMYSQHKLAKQCFEKALEINNSYPTAITGLEIADRKFQEFTQDLDKTYPMLQLDSSNLEMISIIYNITLKFAFQSQLIPHFKQLNVPELDDMAAHVVEVIYVELEKLSQEISLPSVCSDPTTCYVWSILAGIAATQLWHSDWPTLKQTGLLHMIMEEVGVYSMDEYILRQIYGETENQEKAITMIKVVAECLKSFIPNDRLSPQKIITLMQACYRFGITYRMQELGFK